MKLSVFLLPLILFASTLGLNRLTTVEVQSLSRAEQKFMMKMADARLSNIHQGQMAMQYGTTEAVRQYGEKMVQDEMAMMNELQKLAASKNFDLPESMSSDRTKWARNLKTEAGDQFDEKFIKVVLIDHRKDVKYFSMATKFEDVALREFAAKYLPVVESHLNSAKNLNQ